MNIAPSPDPALCAIPGQDSAAVTSLTNAFAEILFTDLMGTPQESGSDGKEKPAIMDEPPRKQATDATDAALATLLPFLLAQTPQTPPAPMPADDPNPDCSATLDSDAPSAMKSRTMPVVPNTPVAAVFPSAVSKDNTIETRAPIQVPDEKMSPATGNPHAAARLTEQTIPFAESVRTTGREHFEGSIRRRDFTAIVPFDSETIAPAAAEFGAKMQRALPTLPTGIAPTEFSQAAAQSASSSTGSPVGEMIQRRDFAAFVPQDSGTIAAPAAAESAPGLQSAQPADSETKAPAEFSRTAEQSSSSTAEPRAETARENAIGQMQPARSADGVRTTESDGTTVAMQRRAMPEHYLDRTLKTKANVAVPSSAHSDSRAVVLPELRDRPAAARKAEPSPVAPAMAGISFEPPADTGRETDAPTAADFTAAVRITKQTIDLAEHVRTMGRDHVEVQMRLRDGAEVTVSLRLEHGEWKPVFKTDTDALCRALEQNWHRAAAQPSAQAVKFGTPVFESQRTQTDPGQNPQQQPDGRGRSFDRREQETAFGVPAPRAHKNAAAAKPARPATTTAVQLYA